jgi:hypothetical protein
MMHTPNASLEYVVCYVQLIEPHLVMHNAAMIGTICIHLHTPDALWFHIH